MFQHFVHECYRHSYRSVQGVIDHKKLMTNSKRNFELRMNIDNPQKRASSDDKNKRKLARLFAS